MSAAEGALFARIREHCAAVAADARDVQIVRPRLDALAQSLAEERPKPASLDPAHEPFADSAHTLAFVLTMNALNFGSGWFPHLRKRGGLSGYRSLATALRERFDREGPYTATALQRLRPADCAALFDQRLEPPVDELMKLYAQALTDLGSFLEKHWDGRFEGPVEEAAGSAERLVESLARMPLYRDVERWHALDVPFYKRAQITASDLAEAFGGEGLGCFRDLDALTIFADNLVPHVLRMHGVLDYAPDLAERIARGQLIPAGSPEEIEIRAVALHAVEELVAACRALGWPTTARELDGLFWTRGQAPAIKAVPRHRTRCTFY